MHRVNRSYKDTGKTALNHVLLSYSCTTAVIVAWMLDGVSCGAMVALPRRMIDLTSTTSFVRASKTAEETRGRGDCCALEQN